MYALTISLDLIYKSESLAEVSSDNTFFETYDGQGLGINTTNKILHALKELTNTEIFFLNWFKCIYNV